jgi:glycosyltransferase involved in cell wall biosynthesis
VTEPLPEDFEAAVGVLKERPRLESEERMVAFADGKAAEHPFGVLYQGEWETPADGTSAAVRLHARALAATGVPVLLKSFSGRVVTADGVVEHVAAVGVPGVVKREVGTLNETSIGTLGPLIKHVVISDAEHARRFIMPRYVEHEDPEILMALRSAVYRSTIVYSVWERDRIDPGITRQLSSVAECWVPCEQNAELLRSAGVPEERVHVVPHPYDENDPICRLVQRSPAKHREPRFYAIGRWEPRKGYAALIEAFLRAFRPSDGCRLTIKYHGGDWQGYPKPEQALVEAARRTGWTEQEARSAVELISRRLPRDRIVELHYRNNIYVASSHGEAWCLPAFEAKLAGNLLVHVPYGGTADFSAVADVDVPYALGPVHPSYAWEPDAQWATYDTDALAEALKTAALATVLFVPPPQFQERFGMRAVGRLMRERALSVLDQVSHEAADYLRAQSESSALVDVTDSRG